MKICVRGRGYGPTGPPRFRGPPPPNWGRGGRGGRFNAPGGWREDWERPAWGPMGPPPPGFNGPPGMIGPPGMVCYFIFLIFALMKKLKVNCNCYYRF